RDPTPEPRSVASRPGEAARRTPPGPTPPTPPTGERMTHSNRWQVDVDGETTTAVYQPASNGDVANAPVFVCAHGAGGNFDDRAMKQTASALAERGISVVRYN